MTLLITRADVEKLFSSHRREVMDALVRNVDEGYREVASGSAQEHPRVYLRSKTDPERRPPGLFSMSALLPGVGRMGTRLLALGGAEYADGDAMLILFDQRTKKCLSIMWDQGLHNYRTGTPAALAARTMSRPDAESIGVIGSGGIAEGTLAMVHHVRPSVKTVRVYSRSPENRERFSKLMSAYLGCDVRPVESAAEATRGADIVITATDADRPLVPDHAVGPGTHISAMARNEVDPVTLRRSKIVLSSRSATEALDPPLRDPIPEASIVGDLADIVSGKAQLGYSPAVITVFAGGAPLAMWDVAAASAVFEIAGRLGLGKTISLYE
jgi:alanine dehydrogenase